jgi:hypothetical protein
MNGFYSKNQSNNRFKFCHRYLIFTAKIDKQSIWKDMFGIPHRKVKDGRAQMWKTLRCGAHTELSIVEMPDLSDVPGPQNTIPTESTLRLELLSVVGPAAVGCMSHVSNACHFLCLMSHAPHASNVSCLMPLMSHAFNCLIVTPYIFSPSYSQCRMSTTSAQ